uniref:Ribosomal protein S1 n=1 Tax=Dipterosiphonia australica TaxID=2007208 RepID=A0A1Z1MM43_9FLOR|nr:ribosomal protein S1 [Dipterosiphonia australica]ARW66922.1 ribosomal protein S1 [Dipterosiphonia australica]
MTKKKNKFKEILKKYKYRLHSGDIVAGTVIHNEKAGFLVDIGTERIGYLPNEEISTDLKKNKKNTPQIVNATRDFFLITENKSTKQCILSIRRLDYIRAWKRIKQIYSEDIVFNVQINYINKGGIITCLEGIQGFIPKSHIAIKKLNLNNEFQLRKQEDIKCKILTISEHKNQLILSNKSAKLTLLKHKLKIGELLYGQVVSIKSYGLFINIYEIKALLHISEVDRIDNEIYKNIVIKDKFIKVKVIHLNNKSGQVYVSVRNLKNNPNHHQQY